jgi:hypothetical protein
MSKIDRLPAERQLRLYTRITRIAIEDARVEGVGLALAAIRNVQDAIARLQEQHVREETR